MTLTSGNPVVIAQVLALVTHELNRANSWQEWKSRLADLGYGYKDTPHGRMLTTLPHGVEIAAFPRR